jgi:hypothetical protein
VSGEYLDDTLTNLLVRQADLAVLSGLHRAKSQIEILAFAPIVIVLIVVEHASLDAVLIGSVVDHVLGKIGNGTSSAALTAVVVLLSDETFAFQLVKRVGQGKPYVFSSSH